jgi:RNA polymerase sigma-70 factor (ECF subfamily)
MLASQHDDALIARALEQDEDASRALVDRYASYVYTIAFRGYGIGREDAREVVQDTFLRLFAALPGYRKEGPFRAWLRQIAVKCCLAHLRRQERPTEALDAALSDFAQQEAIERVERAFAIRQMLRTLDEPCWQVISLFFFEGRTYRDIAAVLGIPEGTVASRLARCLGKLRERARDFV